MPRNPSFLREPRTLFGAVTADEAKAALEWHAPYATERSPHAGRFLAATTASAGLPANSDR